MGRRVRTEQLLRDELGFLADRVATRLRANRCARPDDHRSRPVHGTSIRDPIRHGADRALDDAHPDRPQHGPRPAALDEHPAEREITLLAISVSNLVPESTLQLELPLGIGDERRRPGTPAGSARWALDRATDPCGAKFGRGAVGHAAVVFRDDGGVPDEFRELAEAEHDSNR